MIRQFTSKELKELQSDKHVWDSIKLYLARLNPLILIYGLNCDKLDYLDFIYYLDDLFGIDSMEDDLHNYILTNTEVKQYIEKHDLVELEQSVEYAKQLLEEREISSLDVQ